MKKRKKKHGICNPGIENPVQTANNKNCNRKAKKLKVEKEKLTSNRLSNSSCNLVTYGVERKQYKLQTIKIAAKKPKSSREEKEKLTSNRLSNSICNLVTSNRLSKSIYKKLNPWVLNPRGGN